MGFIRESIISKKLLLVYSEKNIRDRWEGKKGQLNNSSREAIFDEVIDKCVDRNFLLLDYMDVTIDNIEYLAQKGVEIKSSESITLKEKIEILKEKYKEYEIEIQELFEKSKKDYIEGRLDINNFLKDYELTYLKVICLYEEYLCEERKLVEKIIDIWNEELTNCNDYINDENYKFLVYATELEAENVVKNVVNSNAVLHTSYITSKNAKTYRDRKYGLIYELKKDNLLLMNKSDNQVVDKKIKLNSYKFSLNSEFFFIKNGITEVTWTDWKMGRTYLPEQLLSQEYNEINLINNENTIPKAVFVFENADKQWKQEAEKLAKLLSLNVLELKR
ncbi:hypothetical protein D3Z58_12615 [Clostridiaceae bacterium]|nr:hypothetical protein [Clostridiaceae bacterium]